jgi:predicted O-methyltransferase YrrM
MSTYQSRTFVPPLVQGALDLARVQGFERSCLPEVGRLLSVLASHVQGGVVGEIGTGTGVGAAWMLSHMAPTTRFVTVEADERRAQTVQHLLRGLSNAQVIHDDWRVILSYGPFDLLFVDTGAAKAPPGQQIDTIATEMILAALRPGGIVVLDDLTPEADWPPQLRNLPDPVREFWLNDTRVQATEVLTTPHTAAILATRIS